jgi:hypothetical protein
MLQGTHIACGLNEITPGNHNERLTARGECRHLDAKTREMLGLPARQNSRDQRGGAVRADGFARG